MVRQYIGARYVPKFFENSATGDSTWASNTPYEPLTIVTWNNLSYTSKKKVPTTVGAPNLNDEYWVLTGDYSGSIGDISQRLDQAEIDIDNLEDDVDVLQAHEEYFLFPTGNTNDRSADVIGKLTTYGVCYFATGDFYFEHEIVMPQGTTLKGMGSKTRLHLAYNGNLVKMNSFCRVQDVTLIGQETDLPYSSYTQGERVGIYIDGDASDFSTATYTRNYNMISNVTIIDFSGSGIKCHRTGGSLLGCDVTNVIILRCHTGVDIDIFSEFNTFTNVSVRGCNIGCVMQGGNNAFNGCVFMLNLTMVKIDNSLDSLVNQDHSVFCGCIFAHAGTNNNGNIIDFNGIEYGITFTGCTFFHGSIDVKNSVSVIIADSVMGLASQNVKFTSCQRCGLINNQFIGTRPSWTFTGSSNLCLINNFDATGIISFAVYATQLMSTANTTQDFTMSYGEYTDAVECFATCTSNDTITATIPLRKKIIGTYNVSFSSCTVLGVGTVSPSNFGNIDKAANYIRVVIPLTGATARNSYLVDLTYTLTIS